VPTYLDLSRTAEEYTSIEPCIAHDSTLVQVNAARVGSGSLGRTDPFTEETGRLAALTEGHDLGNFEGSFPFFLFRNRADNDPFTYLATSPVGFEEVPPAVDFDTFATRPHGTIDYVVVFGRADAVAATLASPSWTRLAAELATGYRLAARTPDDMVELYQAVGLREAGPPVAIAASSAPPCLAR
jgi:hypothetical protein